MNKKDKIFLIFGFGLIGVGVGLLILLFGNIIPSSNILVWTYIIGGWYFMIGFYALIFFIGKLEGWWTSIA